MGNVTDQVNELAERANAMMAESRLRFEVLVTTQKDERIEMQKLHDAEKEKMRKHYGRIIFGLILALSLLLGGIIGGAIYLFSNYDFKVVNQEMYIGGDGNSTIYDGIHYNRN